MTDLTIQSRSMFAFTVLMNATSRSIDNGIESRLRTAGFAHPLSGAKHSACRGRLALTSPTNKWQSAVSVAFHLFGRLDFISGKPRRAFALQAQCCDRGRSLSLRMKWRISGANKALMHSEKQWHQTCKRPNRFPAQPEKQC